MRRGLDGFALKPTRGQLGKTHRNRFMKGLMRIICLGLLILLFKQPALGVSPDLPFAGKIVGTIMEQETGEILPGASVLIEGTTMGAAADVNGDFLILNVSPGLYRLRVEMLGFATVIVGDVVVQSGPDYCVRKPLNLLHISKNYC